ncbi:MAG: hypothetical protein Q4D35_05840 [Ruminococcus sp.]|nr:hypothetical protein [Ruminococcus sp.]
MLEKGFVKLHRSVCKWEWYKNTATKNLFFHLILTANYEDRAFEGIVVKRGQRAASLSTLSSELGMSVQSIRTATKHLVSTNEITVRSTSRYTLYTVKNYNLYQGEQQAQLQTNNKPLTNGQQSTNNNERKYKKVYKDKKEKEYSFKRANRNKNVQQPSYDIEELEEWMLNYKSVKP